MLQQEKILGKDVYIFDSHNVALMPWSLVRRKLRDAPLLITLDHHTDTIEAFRDYVFNRIKRGDFDIPDDFEEQYKGIAPSLIRQINWNDDASINQAIENLDHDEHIDAAVRAHIISLAVSINLNGFSDNSIRHNIIEVSSNCSVGCNKQPHDDDCQITHYNQVIESTYLDQMLDHANQLAHSVGINDVEAQPYILDIDLDYFHSEQAIAPSDTSTVYRLIRNARAITIAKEPKCVEALKIEGSLITSEYLLEKMIEHINQALS